MIHVKVIDLAKDGELIKSIRVRSYDQYEADIPSTIFIANKLSLPNLGEVISISNDLYDTWFTKPASIKLNNLSALLETNFEKILARSELILSSKEYFNIHTDLLYSGMSIGGTTRYSLGSVIKSWIEEDAFYLPDENLYMIKIGGSPLSGSHVYTAWSPDKKKFVKGHLQKKYGGWMQYFSAFRELGKQNYGAKTSSVLSIEKLLKELGITDSFSL